MVARRPQRMGRIGQHFFHHGRSGKRGALFIIQRCRFFQRQGMDGDIGGRKRQHLFHGMPEALRRVTGKARN